MGLKMILVTNPLLGPYFDLPGFDLGEKIPLFPKINQCKFLVEYERESSHKLKFRTVSNLSRLGFRHIVRVIF